MTVTILPDKVFFDGHDLLKLRESKHFLAHFGPPSRHSDTPTHPTGTRIAMVWDHLGLVAYEDQPEGLMSHLYLAFDPKQTPQHPTQSSNLIIEINGGIITSETLEATLPRNGPTQILQDAGKHFFHEASAYTIDFGFERFPNPNGRYPKTGRLNYFSFVWRKAPCS